MTMLQDTRFNEEGKVQHVEVWRNVEFSGYGNPLNALKQLGHFPPKLPQASAK